MKNTIDFEIFKKVDIRVGTVISSQHFKKATTPAYILKIDFGELGILKSSAQITNLYTTNDLVGKQIIAVVNFKPKQIANIMSECLVLGVVNKANITLITPDKPVENGLKIA